jgi:hypothetical protein
MNANAKCKAEVISLNPVEVEEEGWPAPLLEKLSERMWLLGEFIEGHGRSVDIHALLRTQKEIFELCTLYWAGLAPDKAKAAIDGIAPKWARLNELMESNRTKAQALLRKRAS